jgi:hypothetical protein
LVLTVLVLAGALAYWFSTSDLVTPAQILPTERNVTVHVPRAHLQAAIDAFSK